MGRMYSILHTCTNWEELVKSEIHGNYMFADLETAVDYVIKAISKIYPKSSIADISGNEFEKEEQVKDKMKKEMSFTTYVDENMCDIRHIFTIIPLELFFREEE